jgi:hypothetical protein
MLREILRMPHCLHNRPSELFFCLWCIYLFVSVSSRASVQLKVLGKLIRIIPLIWSRLLAQCPNYYATVCPNSVPAPALSHLVSTAAARVPTRVKLCGICGGQSSTGAGFLLVLRSPMSLTLLTVLQSSPSTIQGWYNGPINGRSNRRLGSTPAP